MKEVLQGLLAFRTILLCGMLFPTSIRAQDSAQNIRYHAIKEVAIIKPKMDAWQLLQKLVAEKHRQFHDTQITYILTREDETLNQRDTLPDGLLLSFRDGAVNDVSTFPYISSSQELYKGWKFAVFSFFDPYILFEESIENLFLSNAQGYVKASLTEDTKSFYMYGGGKYKDSICYFYQFKDTGMAEMVSYYDFRRYGKPATRVFYYPAHSVFPVKVIYTIKEAPDIHYILQSADINLEEKVLTPFHRMKPIEALLKR